MALDARGYLREASQRVGCRAGELEQHLEVEGIIVGDDAVAGEIAHGGHVQNNVIGFDAFRRHAQS